MASIIKRGSVFEVAIRKRGFPAQSKRFTTKREAAAWAATIESEMVRGAFIDRSQAERTTLKQLVERYIVEVVPNHRGADAEVQHLKAVLNSPAACRSVATLTGADFAKYRDDRLQGRGCRKVKAATVVRELQIVKRMINTARREWDIGLPENPIDNVRFPRVSNARTRRFHIGEEQYLLASLELGERADDGTLGSGVRNPWVRPMVLLAIETAMRRGELLSLRWKNVDLDRRVAHLPLTKNGESRDVPLSSKAAAILDALPRSIGGQVFPITADALKKCWQRAMKRAIASYVSDRNVAEITADPDFLRNFRFHDLRHEATTRLAERVTNPLELARITGHKDLKMLLRYYNATAEELAKKLG